MCSVAFPLHLGPQELGGGGNSTLLIASFKLLTIELAESHQVLWRLSWSEGLSGVGVLTMG